MKISVNFNLKGLEGGDIKDINGSLLNVGKLLGNTIMSAAKIDGMDLTKAVITAQDFYKTGEAELTGSELEALIKFVENCETITILAKSQIKDELLKQKS